MENTLVDQPKITNKKNTVLSFFQIQPNRNDLMLWLNSKFFPAQFMKS